MPQSVCRWLDKRGVELADATRDDCAEYLAERESSVADSTAHKDYQHMRWLYMWLVEDGEIDTRHELRPRRGVQAPKVNDPDPDRTRVADDADYARLLASFDWLKTLDCRNAAMVSLMYRSGVRSSEIVRCHLDRGPRPLAIPDPFVRALARR